MSCAPFPSTAHRGGCIRTHSQVRSTYGVANQQISLAKNPARFGANFRSRRHAVQSQLGTALELVDSLEIDENGTKEASAISMLTSLTEEGVLIGFEGAQQVPKRDYSLADLRLNKIEAEKLLAPVDNTITTTKTWLQIAAASGMVATVIGGWLDITQALGLTVIGLFVVGADQVAQNGGIEFLVVDTLTRVLRPTYAERVAWHEAGHFLIAYLIGLLPKGYTLSAVDAYKQYKKFNVQAGTIFCDTAFMEEVQSGQVKASSVDRVACVALAGVVGEYIKFDHAEGGLNDIIQLDQLMKALKFSQKKADNLVRWAVINDFILLKRHANIQDALAKQMANGASVGKCIETIEGMLKKAEFV